MKLSYLLGVIALFIFCSCSKDDGEPFTEIDDQEIPYGMKSFFDLNFPNKTPEKIIKYKVPDAITGILYRANFENGTQIDFVEEGRWKNIKFHLGFDIEEDILTNILVPEIKEYINEDQPHAKILTISNEDYGTCFALDNKEQLAFSWKTFLGYVLYSDNYNQLPKISQDFLLKHFPHIEVKDIIDLKRDETWKTRYKVWLDDFYIEFDHVGNYTLISSLVEKLLVPESIIMTFPDGLKDDLNKLYPEAEIGEIYRFSESNYQVRLSDLNSYVYPGKNLNFSTKKFNSMIGYCFGEEFYSMKTIFPLNTEENIFHVALLNGFDFTLDQDYGWLVINGHGYEFPTLMYDLLPYSISAYFRENYPDLKISKADNTVPYGYYITLTNGEGFKFSIEGELMSKQTIKLAPFEKATDYVRYHYPEEVQHAFNGVYNGTFELKNGTLLKFDTDGNVID